MVWNLATVRGLQKRLTQGTRADVPILKYYPIWVPTPPRGPPLSGEWLSCVVCLSNLNFVLLKSVMYANSCNHNEDTCYLSTIFCLSFFFFEHLQFVSCPCQFFVSSSVLFEFHFELFLSFLFESFWTGFLSSLGHFELALFGFAAAVCWGS